MIQVHVQIPYLMPCTLLTPMRRSPTQQDRAFHDRVHYDYATTATSRLTGSIGLVFAILSHSPLKALTIQLVSSARHISDRLLTANSSQGNRGKQDLLSYTITLALWK